MFLIRKINKPLLQKLEPTTDIILSVTNTRELFVNDQNGNQLKITDIEAVDTLRDLADIVPVVGKFYFIKENTDLRLYVDAETGYISLRDEVVKLINEVKKNVTTLEQSVSALTNTVAEDKKQLEDSITELESTLTGQISSINSALSALQETVNTHDGNISSMNASLSSALRDITVIQQRIADVAKNVSTLTERLANDEKNIDDLTKQLAKTDQSITNVSNTVTENTSSINTLNETVGRHSDEIAGLNTRVSIKDYHAVFDVNKLKQSRIEPEIYIPSYIFNATEKMFITKLTLRTRTAPTEAITFELKYVAELENGSVAEEVDIDEITLGEGKYVVTKELDKTYAESKGYSNGYIVAYIKDPGANHPEATLMLDLCVRVPI